MILNVALNLPPLIAWMYHWNVGDGAWCYNWPLFSERKAVECVLCDCKLVLRTWTGLLISHNCRPHIHIPSIPVFVAKQYVFHTCASVRLFALQAVVLSMNMPVSWEWGLVPLLSKWNFVAPPFAVCGEGRVVFILCRVRLNCVPKIVCSFAWVEGEGTQSGWDAQCQTGPTWFLLKILH